MTRPTGVRATAAWSAALIVTVVLTATQGSAAAPPSGSASSGSASSGSASSGSAPGTEAGAGAAQSAADAAAARVAALDASVRRTTNTVATLSRAADVAQARVDRELVLQRADTVRVRQASARAARAAVSYQQAHAAYVQAVTAEYEGSSDTLVSTAGQLLVAPDPGQFLVTTAMTSMVSRYQSAVTSQDQLAASASSSAAASLAAALSARRTATARLQSARNAATHALSTASRSLRSLRVDLASAKVDQARTDAVLSHFLGGWAIADPARADALDRHYLELARQNSSAPLAPAGHGWSAAQGESVVWRTLMWIGTPYAWAGGNSGGPTAGRCVAGDAKNDCHVVGFDCSGLSLYGWAPYLSMEHLASAQYGSAGRQHPDIAHLLPGDLVFWSSNGSVGGIHHVALYIGDGLVVQAPNSGDIVRVTPLGAVDSGYFGATRPRT